MAETTNNNPNRRPRRAARPGHRVAGNVGKIVGTLFLIGITTCAILACFATVYIKAVILPQSQVNAGDYALNLSSTIYYSDPKTGENKELKILHGGENRVLVSYDQIPEDLVHAAVAIEDQRFYKHNGVDWKRTGGAFLHMFLGMKDNYGGSTITQQLIKNITEQDDVTVKRKILEIFRALEYEKKHSKEKILEGYLNHIYLGERCYGVSTAAFTYFGKDVSQLSLAECASLIGITNNPSKYDPYLSENTRQHNKDRQIVILNEMEKQGYITAQERDAAKAEELHFQKGVDDTNPIAIYSWYEDQVIRDVIADLQDSQDWSEKVATMAVYSGGLKIYSCYNPDVQQAVDAVYENPESLPYKSTAGQPIQSAMTIVDNATGNVVAIAGGLGEKEKSLIYNRAVKAKRPPGSSIKPLAVYAPAIEMGLITPATVIDDSPFMLNGGTPWPVNSFGYYKGLTTVYEGLQNSVNTVATKVMGNYTSPDIAYDFLTGKLGLTSLVLSRDINGKNYSDIGVAQLALGGLTDGVSTYEMAAAYSSFPRNGVYIAPRTYTKVTANDGVTVLLDNEPKSVVAMKDTTAWYINYMLKNAVDNGTGGSANFSGMEVAGKTGTTSSRKDLWFAGYTPYYTGVVWTGFDQQERMGSGLNNPSTVLWRKVMSKVHEGLAYKDFDKPESAAITTASYCKDSGLRPGEFCTLDPRGGRVTSGSFAQGDAPTQYCTIHGEPVTVCLDSPILNANGEKTGMFHLAGPHCPEASLRKISLVNYPREGAEAAATTSDHIFTKAYMDSLGDAAYCDIHKAPAEPEPTVPVPGSPQEINPWDASTWPDANEYPNFNPFDETTWPGYQAPETETPPGPSASLPPTAPDVNEPVVPAVN